MYCKSKVCVPPGNVYSASNFVDQSTGIVSIFEGLGLAHIFMVKVCVCVLSGAHQAGERVHCTIAGAYERQSPDHSYGLELMSGKVLTIAMIWSL